MLKGEKSSSKAFQKVELRMEKINIFSLVIFPFFVQANGRLKTSPPKTRGSGEAGKIFLDTFYTENKKGGGVIIRPLV